MRELREFRVAHERFVQQGVAVAGVTRDSPESNLDWSARLKLPYPLLADVDHEAGEALRLVRRFGIGGWNIEMFRRSTVLVDTAGKIAAVWGSVKIRGHATQVLTAAAALDDAG